VKQPTREEKPSMSKRLIRWINSKRSKHLADEYRAFIVNSILDQQRKGIVAIPTK
jgi:hypothetical protein